MAMTQFNPSQLAAIGGTEDNKVIVAPAGSGKTATIVGAVHQHRKDYPFDHIVAITFTRKAAEELKQRIGVLANVEVSTIHSWAYRRLAELAADYNFKVQLLEDEVIKEILGNLCRRNKFRYVNQFLLFSYAMGNYNVEVDESTLKLYETIRRQYVAFKEKNQLYDFTDLPTYLYDKLIEYGITIRNVDALFVDEFQDIDPIQLKLFDRIETHKRCYIGDPAQAIYAFRGAVEEVFDQLEGFTTYTLNENYRSYQEIIDYAYSFRTQALELITNKHVVELTDTTEDMSSVPIHCQRGNGGTVFIISEIGSCIDQDGNHYSDHLTMANLLSTTDTQILCRSNKQVKKIKSYGFENVSTIHQAKGLEYENVVLVSFPCDRIEEVNIAYVGATRAKDQLCVVNYEVLCYLIAAYDIEPVSNTNKLF